MKKQTIPKKYAEAKPFDDVKKELFGENSKERREEKERKEKEEKRKKEERMRNRKFRPEMERMALEKKTNANYRKVFKPKF